MGKPTSNIPEDILTLYEKLVDGNPDVERKGKTTPYTSLNGHMFSFLTKEGKMALRLPTEAREKFLVDFDTELCVQYERVMKEYVIVPDDLFKDTTRLEAYFSESFTYISSLKPKPTKK